jgi:hypothetical protein
MNVAHGCIVAKREGTIICQHHDATLNDKW